MRMTRLDAGKGQTEVSAWQVMSPLQAAGRKWPQDTKQQGGQEQSQGALGEGGRQLNSQEHQVSTGRKCCLPPGWRPVPGFLGEESCSCLLHSGGHQHPLGSPTPHLISLSPGAEWAPEGNQGRSEGHRPQRAGKPPRTPHPVPHVAGGQGRLSLRSPLWELLTGKAGEQQDGCPVKSSRQPALRDRLCSPNASTSSGQQLAPPRLQVLPQGIGRSPSTCPGLMDREGQ